MKNYTLMDPALLQAEISRLEATAPQTEQRVAEMKTRLEAAYQVFRDTEVQIDGTTQYRLNSDQMNAVVLALAGFEIDIYQLPFQQEATLKAYKNLLADRRWTIGSMLKFLKKK